MRMIDAAIGAAWAMEESALVSLLEVANRERQITPEALTAYRADTLDKAEQATFRDGVAILDIAGPLFKRANLMTSFCGATSYESLMRDFTTAIDDDGVLAVMLNVDSPGGEVAGCAEFAQAIFDARGKKPIVAYAGDQACSAAYWIASACDSIVIGASSGVGSIGVRATVPDAPARDARSGVTRYDFISSQSPHKASDPKTDDGAARLQARVDALAAVFVETVARNRNVTVGRVLDGFGKGDVFVGGAAIAAGIADRFGSFESTLAELASAADPRGLARVGIMPSRSYTVDQASEASAVDAMLATIGLFTARSNSAETTRPAASGDTANDAAATILQAFHATSPATGNSASETTRPDDEAAVAAILGALPPEMRKKA